MARRPHAHVEALRLIAQGRSDAVGAETITGAFFACVRVAREALGICAHCREHLAGNRCRECDKTHSESLLRLQLLRV